MPKFSIPDRKYCDGKKKMVSLRVPERLLKELEELGAKKGWTVTDLVLTSLDQYVQWERGRRGAGAK